MVMGIIGNTQGVKMEARPNPKATSRNAARTRLPRPAWRLGRLGLGVSRRNRALPAAGAAGSTVKVAAARPAPRHALLSLQVW